MDWLMPIIIAVERTKVLKAFQLSICKEIKRNRTIWIVALCLPIVMIISNAGNHDYWLTLSDHIPVIVEIK